MKTNETTAYKNLAESMAELTCELAKTCNQKEVYFAAMFNLTPAEFKCLRLFSKKNSLSIKDLSKVMDITPGRITHILSSLEHKNFVKRKADSSDKRNVIVELTPKSEPFIKNLNASHTNIHREILEKIEPDKREIVVSAMEEVLKALQLWSADYK